MREEWGGVAEDLKAVGRRGGCVSWRCSRAGGGVCVERGDAEWRLGGSGGSETGVPREKGCESVGARGARCLGLSTKREAGNSRLAGSSWRPRWGSGHQGATSASPG
jgi:hypothetical protein